MKLNGMKNKRKTYFNTRYDQHTWLSFINCCYCCFLIVNRLFLSNLCQWHNDRSFHFWTFLTKILTIPFSLFKRSFFKWVQHEFPKSSKQFTEMIVHSVYGHKENSSRYLMMNLQCTVYFWTNEKQIKTDRNFYLTLFISISIFISIIFNFFCLFIQQHTHLL